MTTIQQDDLKKKNFQKIQLKTIEKQSIKDIGVQILQL